MSERLVVGFYLACGALLLFLSTIIWRESPKSRINRTTAFMLGFAGLGTIFSAIGYSLGPAALSPVGGTQPFLRNLHYVWELFFPCLLLFSLEFPFRHPLLSRYARFRWVLFAPHVFHLLLMLGLARGREIAQWLATQGAQGPTGWVVEQFSRGLGLLSILFEYAIGILLKFFSVVNLAYVIGALFILQRSARKLSAPRLKRQVGVLTWGLRVALGLYTVAFIAPILGVVEIPPRLEMGLLMLALLVGSGGVVYSIVRYQFLDVRLIARQSLVYSATSALLVGAYLLVLGQLSAWVKSQLGRSVPMLEAGFIIVAVIFFQPLMSVIEDGVARFFKRDRTDYRRMVERFSSEIVRIVDLKELQQQVITTLEEDLLVDSVVLVQVLDRPPRIRFFSRARVEGDYADPDLSELLEVLARMEGPVYYESLVAQAQQSQVWSVMATFKPYLIVPLRVGRETAGFLLLSRKSGPYRYSEEDFTVLQVLSNQVGVALSNAALYGESLVKRRMEEELAVAREIQSALLPESLPQSEFYDVDAFTRPAREVGGDFYDFLPLQSGELGVVIGDASGKSVPAALMIAQLQAVLKNQVREGLPVVRVMESLNRCASAGSQGERFVTMVYGLLDPGSGRFRYCNAGHNYPLHVSGDGTWQVLDTGGLLLGVFEEATYAEGEIRMAPGDVLVFYTDGFTEIFDANGIEFGEQRLAEVVSKHRDRGPQWICQVLMQEVLNHARDTTFEDDATVIVLKRKGVAA